MDIHKCMHTSNLFKHKKCKKKNQLNMKYISFFFTTSVSNILCSDKYLQALIKMWRETHVGLQVKKVVAKTVQFKLILTRLYNFYYNSPYQILYDHVQWFPSRRVLSS
jgi:hypothetical protein